MNLWVRVYGVSFRWVFVCGFLICIAKVCLVVTRFVFVCLVGGFAWVFGLFRCCFVIVWMVLVVALLVVYDFIVGFVWFVFVCWFWVGFGVLIDSGLLLMFVFVMVVYLTCVCPFWLFGICFCFVFVCLGLACCIWDFVIWFRLGLLCVISFELWVFIVF